MKYNLMELRRVDVSRWGLYFFLHQISSFIFSQSLIPIFDDIGLQLTVILIIR